MKLNKETNLYELEEADKKPLTQDEKEKQIKYLKGFIDEFKNVMESEKIFGMCRFILISLIDTPEDLKELSLMLDSLEALENLEKEKTLSDIGDAATLADIPHTAYTLLKEVLEDLEGKSPQDLKTDASELLKQLYKRPSSLLMPNNKVTNLMFDENIDLSSQIRLVNEGSDKQKIVVSTQILSELPIEPIDREVLSGVFSIIAASEQFDGNPNPLFTENQLVEAYTGNPKPTEIQREVARESLNRLRTTIINLDWTEYALKLGLPLNDSYFRTNDPILMLHEYQFISGGQMVSGYKVAATPILYTYTKATKRIIQADKPLLKVDINNTPEAIVLKNYMLRRIKMMYNKHNHMNIHKISYEEMFNTCGIKGTPTQLTRKRNTVRKILEAWVKMGYIKDYKELKEGKEIKTIQIFLYTSEPETKNLKIK